MQKEEIWMEKTDCMMQQEIDSFLNGLVQEQKYAGLSVCIARQGQVIYQNEFGSANLEKKIPIKPDTLFHLYSMTKPITAAAVMLLWERGQIELLDPVSEYLPGFTHQNVLVNNKLIPALRDVTIRDLLNMTSGIPYPDTTPSGARMTEVFQSAIDRVGTKEEMDTISLCNAIGRSPLTFQPGERWMYGASADILGGIVEVVTGMRYGAFLKKEFFDPLEMKDTAFFIPPEKLNRLCTIYHTPGNVPPTAYHDKHLVIMDYTADPKFQSGGAGLISTREDYLHFAMMLLQEGEYAGRRILSPYSCQFLRSNQLNEQQRRSMEWSQLAGYGYGNLMRVLLDKTEAATMLPEGEYGWDGWAGTYFAIEPKEKVIILLMTGMMDHEPDRDRRILKNLVYGNLGDK